MASVEVEFSRKLGAGISIGKFRIMEVTDDPVNWWPRQILNFTNDKASASLNSNKKYRISWMVRGSAGAKFSVSHTINGGAKKDSIPERKIPEKANGISNRPAPGGFEHNGGRRVTFSEES